MEINKAIERLQEFVANQHEDDKKLGGVAVYVGDDTINYEIITPDGKPYINSEGNRHATIVDYSKLDVVKKAVE